MHIIELRNPRYATPDNQSIVLEVLFSDSTSHEPLVARATDAPTAAYFASAIEGEYGEIEAYAEPPAPPVSVPASVTQRQARLMLHRQGVLSGVETVIDAMAEPMRTEARIEWEYASAILRDSPLVAAMGAALELDEAGLDALFIAAAEL